MKLHPLGLAAAVAAALLGAAQAQATPVVRCTGDGGMTATLDHSVREVYRVILRFSGGVSFEFQANGVARTDRGFAAMGTRALIYHPDEQGGLTGWVTLGDQQITDLSCQYLR